MLEVGLLIQEGIKLILLSRNKLDNTFNQNVYEEETESEGAEISFSQTDKDFKEDENYTEPEDFSINEKEEAPSIENKNQHEENLSLEEKTHQDISTEQTINQENNISKENNIETTKDFHIENSPQVTKEITESKNQNFNESILEKPKSEDLSHEEPIKENNQKIFDKDIHNLDFEEGENYIAPRRHQKNDRGNEL